MATLRQQNKELKEQNQHLRFENLKMRLDFEVLIDDPAGRAAGKILDKYRRKRKIREEALLALEN